jgi:hypothetical protein
VDVTANKVLKVTPDGTRDAMHVQTTFAAAAAATPAWFQHFGGRSVTNQLSSRANQLQLLHVLA